MSVRQIEEIFNENSPLIQKLNFGTSNDHYSRHPTRIQARGRV